MRDAREREASLRFFDSRSAAPAVSSGLINFDHRLGKALLAQRPQGHVDWPVRAAFASIVRRCSQGARNAKRPGV